MSLRPGTRISCRSATACPDPPSWTSWTRPGCWLMQESILMQELIIPEKRAAMAIFRLTLDSNCRPVSALYAVMMSTALSIFVEVYEAITDTMLGSFFGLGDAQSVTEGFCFMGFMNCFGTLDGLRCHLTSQTHRYWDPHGFCNHTFKDPHW